MIGDSVIKTIHIIDGIQYEKHGWFGCQLKSVEWKRPGLSCEDRERVIASCWFEVFSVRRIWFKWEITWRMLGLEKLSKNKQNNAIREFYNKLCPNYPMLEDRNE